MGLKLKWEKDGIDMWVAGVGATSVTIQKQERRFLLCFTALVDRRLLKARSLNAAKLEAESLLLAAIDGMRDTLMGKPA